MPPEAEIHEEERRRALAALAGLRGAGEACVAALSAASTLRQFAAGQRVFDQGSPARELHVCLSGRLTLGGATPFGIQPLGEARTGQCLAAADLDLLASTC